MKKDVLRIVISLAGLVGLVLFVYWHRKRKFEKEEKAEEEKKIVSVDFEAIGRIVLTAKETGRLVLERREKDPQGKYSDAWAPLSYEFDSLSEWRLAEPVKALPDYYSVNTLIT